PRWLADRAAIQRGRARLDLQLFVPGHRKYRRMPGLWPHLRAKCGSGNTLGVRLREAAMRAVWYDRQGAADEVLVCGELPTPEAGHGEVRVRLEASGVNPSDTYRRRGPPAMEYKRVVTNSDGAGVVDQVGPGVPERWLGKRVWLYNGQRNGRWQGTAAEYIALSSDLVTELADHVSFA